MLYILNIVCFVSAIKHRSIFENIFIVRGVFVLSCMLFLFQSFSFGKTSLTTIEEEVRSYITRNKTIQQQIDELEHKTNKNKEEIYTLALLYYYQGKIFKCIQQCEKLLSIYQQDKSKNNPKTVLSEIKVIRLMGSAYAQIGYIDEGMTLLEKVQDFYTKTKDTTSICVVLNSIASAYARNGFYEKSLEKYKQVLSICKKQSELKVTVFTNLILLYSILGEYTLSLSYLDSVKPYSDTLSARLKNSFLLYSVYPLLYFQKDKEAIQNFKIAEEFYFKNGIYTSLFQHYKLIIKYFTQKKQYNDLLFYQERYWICLDSVKKIERNKSIERKLLEQEKQKNIEARHALAVKQSKIHSKNIFLLFLGSLLFLVLFVFAYLYKKIQLKRSREQQQAQQLLISQHEQNRILQEQKIQQLEENKKLKDFINHQLEHEVQQRTQEILQKENEIIELKKQKMELQILQVEKEALTQTLLLQEKTKLLASVYSQIQELSEKLPTEKQKQELLSILRLLKNNIHTENQWESFKTYFEKIYPTFMQRIAQDFPQLTQQELRYIAYFKIGLSTKEIAKILNVTSNAVRVAKHRIKEKLKFENTAEPLLKILNSEQ